MTPNIVAKIDVFIEKVDDETHNLSHLSAAGDTFSSCAYHCFGAIIQPS